MFVGQNNHVVKFNETKGLSGRSLLKHHDGLQEKYINECGTVKSWPNGETLKFEKARAESFEFLYKDFTGIDEFHTIVVGGRSREISVMLEVFSKPQHARKLRICCWSHTILDHLSI